MRRTRRDISTLQAVPLFEGVAPDQLEELAAHTDVVRIAAGQVLARAGSTAREYVAVLDGDPTLTDIGAVELIEDRPHQRTVTAGADSTVVVISGSAFRWSARSIPEIARRLAEAA
jgi:hypothetical protein